MGLFSKSTTIPASGFYSQPGAYQTLYNNTLQGSVSSLFGNDNKLKSDLFVPMGQTADETAAFDIARQGMAPTEESLSADVSMLMNPYDDFVIDAINRESMGENSLINQLAGQAGQIGSNRSFLGTSDVEQNRLNNIGQFRQGQYNTAINQALNTLPALRQQDISNLMNIGGFERNLDTATRQAPINAASAAQGMLAGIPTSFGNFGSPEQTIKSKSGFGSLLENLSPIYGASQGNFQPMMDTIGALTGGFGGSSGGFSGLFGGGSSTPMSGSQWSRFLENN